MGGLRLQGRCSSWRVAAGFGCSDVGRCRTRLPEGSYTERRAVPSLHLMPALSTISLTHFRPAPLDRDEDRAVAAWPSRRVRLHQAGGSLPDAGASVGRFPTPPIRRASRGLNLALVVGEHEVVPMHDHDVLVASQGREVLALLSGDRRRFGSPQPREPAADFAAVGRRPASPRRRARTHRARRARRPAARSDRCSTTASTAPRSSKMAPRGRRVNAIQCFRAWMRWGWGKSSVPTSSPAKIAPDGAGIASVGDHDRRAREHRSSRRFDFARHAARAGTTTSTR